MSGLGSGRGGSSAREKNSTSLSDCPGFLVLGAAPPLASTFVAEPQLVLLGQHFASWALGHLLGSAARSSPATCAKTGRTAQVSLRTPQTCVMCV